MGDHYTHKCAYCRKWFATAAEQLAHLQKVHGVMG